MQMSGPSRATRSDADGVAPTKPTGAAVDLPKGFSAFRGDAWRWSMPGTGRRSHHEGFRKTLVSGIALSVMLGAAANAAQTDAGTAPSAPVSGTGGGNAAAKAAHRRAARAHPAKATKVAQRDLTPAVAVSGNGAPASSTATGRAADSGETVTVTAQRRSQNLQDVPISIQVLTGKTLQQLNVENFDDLLRFLPNVTAGGFGPGQDEIYVRGLSVGGDLGGQGTAGGSFPNVALYLDDQSVQLPGHNLDLYAVDLQRVELLEGPQGTLFGAGAQAGVLRYITNKPDLDKFSLTVDGGAGGTAHGGANENADIILNAPLIPDKLAARLVLYDDGRGGYIRNVPGTFVRQSTDKGIGYAGYTNNIPGPATSTNSISNADRVANNINPATYQGIRGEVLYQFDDDWNALLTESSQRLRTDGVFYEEPETSGSSPQTLSPLSVQTFEPNYNRDEFVNTALTLNGRVGFLKLVYDGAYLVRHTDRVQDYTNYARGVFADYYQCQPANPAKGFPTAQCYSPGATWQDISHDNHLTQEVRVSTPDNWRARAIAGFFYEDYQIDDQVNFNYLTAPGFTPVGPPAGATVNDSGTRGANTAFFNDIQEGYTQYAIFGSADYDIIPKVLTATFGTRWFDIHEYEKGAAASSFGCSVFYTSGAPCTAGATNLDAEHLESGFYGFRNRANLTWKIVPNVMVYYTYSEGFRPGGFNRTTPMAPGFIGPISYGSDSLTNNEVGYKMQFFNRRLTLDGAFYQEDWNNVQEGVFDPAAFGNLAFTTNGPNYRVRGTELQATARVTHDLTLTGGFSANDTKQENSPAVPNASGVPYAPSVGAFGDVNNTLALSPALKANIRARYQFDYRGFLPFVQIGATYQSHSHSSVQIFDNFDMKSYSIVDASAGVSKKNWRAEIFVDNLTDQKGQEFISSAQFVESVVVTRPLIAGLKLSYTFE